MMLLFDKSCIYDLSGDVRIYAQDGMVVVESPVTTRIQFVLPNGMSMMRDVKIGRNVYNTGIKGIVIVKVGDYVKKFNL